MIGEQIVSFPVRVSWRVAQYLGQQTGNAISYVGQARACDNGVMALREHALTDIETAYMGASLPRCPQARKTEADRAEEATEQAAAPELALLYDFVSKQGPKTGEEFTHIDPQAPPEPFALRQFDQLARQVRLPD